MPSERRVFQAPGNPGFERAHEPAVGGMDRAELDPASPGRARAR